MKIAISSNENDINGMIDQRFGRCKYFLIANLDNGKIIDVEPMLNLGLEQGHGAGIKAAEQIADKKVDYVLTGELGPNAVSILDKLNILSYRASGKIKDAIDMFLENKLERISETSEPHHEVKTDKVNTKSSKSERIFIPLLDNQGMESEISEHFGHAPFFAIYNSDKKSIKIEKNNLDHADANKSPVDQIIELANPTTIFALGIGARAVQLFNEKGITIKTGNCFTVKDVIDNLETLGTQLKDCGHKH